MRNRPILVALVFFVCLAGRGVSASGDEDARATLRRLNAEAQAAYAAGDHGKFLELSRSIVAVQPRSVRGNYNLACAEALNGNPGAALTVLEGLAEHGVTFRIDADDDLASLRGHQRFEKVLARMMALREPIARAQVAFSLPETDLLTEGLARDPKTGDFFVASVHRRKILRVADGRATVFVPEGGDGLLAVFGMAVDPARRALWGASDTIAQMSGATELPEDTRGFVFEYDLDTAKLRRKLGPPENAPDARFADLGLGPDGSVYVSDPYHGRVYASGPDGAALRVLVEAGPLASPQGIAPSADGRTLFVADYSQGIAKIDAATGAVSWLGWPDDAVLSGIDGLVRAGETLIAVQNGLTPHRLLRLRLDPAATRVVATEVLERANPAWDEPTLALVEGDDLYYVGASQWGRFGDDGSVDEAKLRPPVVMRLKLD